MGKARPATILLDAGTIIAFERGNAKMRALLREVLSAEARLIVPAGVVGQVFRIGARQDPLQALLNQPCTTVPALDRPLAEAAGTLCGRTGTSDVIDATVALLARKYSALVVTSDAGELRRIAPELILAEVRL